MTPEQLITGWIRSAEWQWEALRERWDVLVQRSQSGTARRAIEGWDLRLRDPVLVSPAQVATDLASGCRSEADVHIPGISVRCTQLTAA